MLALWLSGSFRLKSPFLWVGSGTNWPLMFEDVSDILVLALFFLAAFVSFASHFASTHPGGIRGWFGQLGGYLDHMLGSESNSRAMFGLRRRIEGCGQVYTFRGRKTVCINRDGASFFVMAFPQNNLVRMTTAWPEPGLRIRISPETPETKRLAGVRDIQVGAADFDAAFIVESNHEDRLLAMMDPLVRELIFAIGTELQLMISGGRVQLDLVQPMTTNEESKQAQVRIETFMALVAKMSSIAGGHDTPDGLHLTRIQSEKAICLVCGDCCSEDKDQLVVCTICESPHHRECWDYFGSCSTFACPSTERRSE